MFRPIKVLKVGSSLGIVLPVEICEELNIHRGEFFAVRVTDVQTIFLRRINSVEFGDIGPVRDKNLPVIKHD